MLKQPSVGTSRKRLSLHRLFLGVALLSVVSLPRDTAAQRWVLLYAGGMNHPRYSVTQLEHLLYRQDSSSRRPLFDGVVCLETHSPFGHAFLSWTSGPPTPRDYDGYLDSLLAPSGVMAAADSVARAHSDTILVAVMVPYPLGRVSRNPPWDERITFLAVYMERAESLFAARRLSAVKLWGFYWLPEDVAPADTAIVQRFTTLVHWHGLRALWIPYYVAKLAPRWRSLGFDAAFLQPNYFMDTTVGPVRVDSALARATAWDIGLEIEFDRRLLTHPAYRSRLGPYLDVLQTRAGQRLRRVAVYDGAGALWELAAAQDDTLKEIYKRLVELLEQR